MSGDDTTMPVPLAVVGVLAAIRLAMQTSSELAPSVAQDVSILRNAFSTGNNKRQLQALRAQALNTGARLAALNAQQRIDLDANKAAVDAMLASFEAKFSADGQITTDEFATIMSLQSIANNIGAGYRHLQEADILRQELEAASAAPQD